MIDQLRAKLRENFDNLIDNNLSAIAQELHDSPEGKLALAFPVVLTATSSRLYVQGNCNYARKFSDEWEGMAELDDGQGKLPMDRPTVEIRTPDGKKSMAKGKE